MVAYLSLLGLLITISVGNCAGPNKKSTWFTWRPWGQSATAQDALPTTSSQEDILATYATTDVVHPTAAVIAPSQPPSYDSHDFSQSRIDQSIADAWPTSEPEREYLATPTDVADFSEVTLLEEDSPSTIPRPSQNPSILRHIYQWWFPKKEDTPVQFPNIPDTPSLDGGVNSPTITRPCHRRKVRSQPGHLFQTTADATPPTDVTGASQEPSGPGNKSYPLSLWQEPQASEDWQSSQRAPDAPIEAVVTPSQDHTMPNYESGVLSILGENRSPTVPRPSQRQSTRRQHTIGTTADTTGTTQIAAASQVRNGLPCESYPSCLRQEENDVNPSQPLFQWHPDLCPSPKTTVTSAPIQMAGSSQMRNRAPYESYPPCLQQTEEPHTAVSPSQPLFQFHPDWSLSHKTINAATPSSKSTVSTVPTEMSGSSQMRTRAPNKSYPLCRWEEYEPHTTIRPNQPLSQFHPDWCSSHETTDAATPIDVVAPSPDHIGKPDESEMLKILEKGLLSLSWEEDEPQTIASPSHPLSHFHPDWSLSEKTTGAATQTEAGAPSESELLGSLEDGLLTPREKEQLQTIATSRQPLFQWHQEWRPSQRTTYTAAPPNESAMLDSLVKDKPPIKARPSLIPRMREHGHMFHTTHAVDQVEVFDPIEIRDHFSNKPGIRVGTPQEEVEPPTIAGLSLQHIKRDQPSQQYSESHHHGHLAHTTTVDRPSQQYPESRQHGHMVQPMADTSPNNQQMENRHREHLVQTTADARRSHQYSHSRNHGQWILAAPEDRSRHQYPENRHGHQYPESRQTTANAWPTYQPIENRHHGHLVQTKVNARPIQPYSDSRQYGQRVQTATDVWPTNQPMETHQHVRAVLATTNEVAPIGIADASQLEPTGMRPHVPFVHTVSEEPSSELTGDY